MTHEAVPHSSFVTLPRAAHFPHLEDPRGSPGAARVHRHAAGRGPGRRLGTADRSALAPRAPGIAPSRARAHRPVRRRCARRATHRMRPHDGHALSSDLQGVRHPWHLRRADRRRRGRADRARLRARALRARGQAGERAARRPGSRHAPGAPELAARYCEGLTGEGAHVLDAGMVATEMLYYLVGSRELDGGLMCTASHNPKAYTGAKLVREGAIALSGDDGIQDIRRMIEDGAGAAGTARAPAGAPSGGVEQVDIYAEFQRRHARLHRPGARCEPLKVVVDGGNGMAGPMVGPLLERLGLELIETYWTPDGNFPDHEPNPLLQENRRVDHRARPRQRRRPRDRLGRRRRPLLLHRRDGRVRRWRLPHRAAGGVAAREAPGGGDPLRRAGLARGRRTPSSAAGGTRHVNRVGHAFFKARMRKEGSLFGGEVSGHYYFRDFYCADSGTIPALLDARAASRGATEPLSELLRPYREHYFISGEINSEVSDQEAKMDGARRALRRRPRSPPRRHLDRLRGLALQRAPLQHRAAAAAVPGVAASRARTWSAAATRCSR